jgi:hypothetical protein
MKSDQGADLKTVFSQMLTGAASHLKDRLRRGYEQAYPRQGDVIRIVLDEEEAKAWKLSPLSHLFLPDLVEAHIGQPGLQPVVTRYGDEVAHPASAKSKTISFFRFYVDR